MWKTNSKVIEYIHSIARTIKCTIWSISTINIWISQKLFRISYNICTFNWSMIGISSRSFFIILFIRFCCNCFFFICRCITSIIFCFLFILFRVFFSIFFWNSRSCTTSGSCCFAFWNIFFWNISCIISWFYLIPITIFSKNCYLCV